jgi:hypothetical protein
MFLRYTHFWLLSFKTFKTGQNGSGQNGDGYWSKIKDLKLFKILLILKSHF